MHCTTYDSPLCSMTDPENRHSAPPIVSRCHKNFFETQETRPTTTGKPSKLLSLLLILFLGVITIGTVAYYTGLRFTEKATLEYSYNDICMDEHVLGFTAATANYQDNKTLLPLTIMRSNDDGVCMPCYELLEARSETTPAPEWIELLVLSIAYVLLSFQLKFVFYHEAYTPYGLLVFEVIRRFGCISGSWLATGLLSIALILPSGGVVHLDSLNRAKSHRSRTKRRPSNRSKQQKKQAPSPYQTLIKQRSKKSKPATKTKRKKQSIIPPCHS